MLTRRIIPCLDVKDNRVVKGVNFLNLRDAGDPVELGKRYSDSGADELVFLDITATIEARVTAEVLRNWRRFEFCIVSLPSWVEDGRRVSMRHAIHRTAPLSSEFTSTRDVGRIVIRHLLGVTIAPDRDPAYGN